MRIFLLVLLVWPAAAAAQPELISASVAVTWLGGWGAGASGVRVDEAPVSLGVVSPPALVVLWRGQPGWTFRSDGRFSGGGGAGTRAGESGSLWIAVTRGDVRLELEYGPRTRTVRVNGRPVPLPEGHGVVLIDHVDEEPEVVRTLSLAGEEPEPVEVFLGRSQEIREFMRCDVPLPADIFFVAGVAPDLAGRFRDFMQETLDERCRLMGGNDQG